MGKYNPDSIARALDHWKAVGYVRGYVRPDSTRRRWIVDLGLSHESLWSSEQVYAMCHAWACAEEAARRPRRAPEQQAKAAAVVDAWEPVPYLTQDGVTVV